MASVQRGDTLQERLKDPGYKNWLKAGMCLIRVKEGLEMFMDAESKSQHSDMLNTSVPCGHCTQDGLKQKNNQNLCSNCDSFKREIKNMYRYGRLNWDNTDVQQWPHNHWSVAKCFMNPGQSGNNVASDTDISGLLNFITLCTRFQDPKYGAITSNAEKVREVRNHLMHSGHDQLSEAELKSCTNDMLKLLMDEHPDGQLKGKKESCIAIDRIQEVVKVNFFITLEDEYEVRLAALDGRIDLIQSELQETIEKLQKAEQNFEKGTTLQGQEIENTSEDVRDLKMKYDQLSPKLDKIQEDQGVVETLKVDLQVHHTWIGILANRVEIKFNSVKQENRKIKCKFDELQIQQDELKSRMKQLEASITRQDSQLSDHETQIRVHSEKIEDLYTRVPKEDVASQKDDTAEVKKEVAKIKKKERNLKRDIEALKGRVDTMDKELLRKICETGRVDVNDRLLFTIKHGTAEEMEHLFQSGADIDYRSPKGENLLHIACLQGRLDIVKLLHSKNTDLVNEFDNDNRSVGPCVAAGGSVEILEFLLPLGLNPYYTDSTGWNLLHYACFHAKKSMAHHLMEKHPKLLSGETEEGMSVLLCAAFGGNISMFKNIYELMGNSVKLDQSTNANRTNDTTYLMQKTRGQKTLLHMSCLGRSLDMTKYLVETYPKLLDEVDNSKTTPAHDAAYSGNVAVLRCLIDLIDRGTDPWCRTSTEETLLHRACINGQFEMTKYLVETYPEMLHAVDNSKNTPAHAAAYGGNVAVLMYLIDCGTDRWCRTSTEETLLHRACINGQFEMTKYLVQTYPEMLHTVDSSKRTPAHKAAYSGSVSVLRYLINRGTVPLCRTSEEETLLHTSCIAGELEMTKYLVETYPQMRHEVDNSKSTPAHKAAISGNVAVLRYLIDHATDPWCRTSEEETLLHVACLSGELEMTEYLVKSYPKMLHEVDNSNSTPAHNAAISGNVAVLRYLIDNGTNPWGTTSNEETLLHVACINGQLESTKYLVETCPEMLHVVDNSKSTTAHNAAISGNVAVLRYLIDCGTDPCCRTYEKDTLLHRACLSGQLEMTKYLVQTYPRMLDEVDNSKRTPAHKAAYSGSVSVLRYLISIGADPWCRTLQEETLLHRACINGQLEMTKYLVENYPEMLHEVDNSKSTPAHNAAHSGNVSVLIYLIHRGADPWCITFHKETLLHSSCSNGQLKMTKYLVQTYPKMLHKVDNRKRTPGHHAAHSGNVSVLRYLIPRGTNPWCRTSKKETLLHIACLRGQLEMTKYLVETFPKMLHEVDNSKRTPTHQAKQSGNVAVLNYLFDRGTDPCCRTPEAATLLH